MIFIKATYPKYDWNIELFIIVNNPNIDKIISRLELSDCSEEILSKAIDKIINYENSGFTFTNPELHRSIIVINLPDSMREFIDTYEHEKNHVEMHICKEFNIDPFSEQAAYLSGELGKRLFKSMLETILYKQF